MAHRKTYQKPEPTEENGQWKIRYRVPIEQSDGSIRREQKTKCLGSVAEMTLNQARKERDHILQPINDVAPGIEHTGKAMRLLVARWRQAIKPSLKYSTQQSYEWALKRIMPAFEGSVLGSIGKVDIQSFLTDSAKNLAPESVRDLRARLRGLFSIAEDWGWIARGTNPAAGRFRLMERVAKRPRVLLWPKQFWAFAAHLKQPYRTIVILAVLGGLRRGELACLRWSDNPEAGKLVVDEAVYWGNADEENNLPYWRLGTPKTAKSCREVSIGEIAQKALDEWKPAAMFRGKDDFMFAIRTNNPIDLHTAAARHLKPAAKAEGLPSVSWHDLRHTYTTWGRLAGMQPEIMRDQLGHSSVLITLDTYSHVNQTEERASAVAMIDKYAMTNNASNRVM